MMPRETLAQSRLSLEWRTLITAALDARQHAHAPYSHFAVGAAVRSRSGRIFAGCNVENASSGLTVCAERVAVQNAVAHGETEFEALVVVTQNGSTPCGACRQVLSEFCSELTILIADTDGRAWFTTLGALLPDAFPRVAYGEDAQP